MSLISSRSRRLRRRLLRTLQPTTPASPSTEAAADPGAAGYVAELPKRVRKRKRKPEAEAEAAPLASVPAVDLATAASPKASAGTVYVEGLPFDAHQEEVMAVFAAVGEVTELRLPRWQDSGRLRGYGHVAYATAEAATRAIAQLHKRATLKGRWLSVQRPHAPKADAADFAGPRTARPAGGCATVHVKNLPYEVSDDAVRAAFGRCGRVSDVRLARWGHTGRLKGHGYVTFLLPASADAACGAPMNIGGRRVAVDYAPDDTPKGSFRTADARRWATSDIGRKARKSIRNAPLPGST